MPRPRPSPRQVDPPAPAPGAAPGDGARGLLALEGPALRAVLDHLTVGIGIGDPTGAIVSFNAEALRIHGFATEAEMLHALTDYASRFELRYPDGAPMPMEEWPASRAVQAVGSLISGLALARRLWTRIRRRLLARSFDLPAWPSCCGALVRGE